MCIRDSYHDCRKPEDGFGDVNFVFAEAVQPVDYHEKAVPCAPNHVVPISAVPKSGDEHNDHEVDVHVSSTTAS